jgi:hypothetical protein
MAIINVKGYEFNAITIKDSYGRRAQQFKNNIITSLRALGLTEDDVEVELERVAIKRVPASATWYVEGMRLHYSYKACEKYVENLYVVSKIIEFEVNAILEDKKTIEQFITDFTEEEDIEEERKKARELLGVDEDSLDFEQMSKNYKKLAKELHPDMPTGNTEKFKAINRAHKMLKRELE